MYASQQIIVDATNASDDYRKQCRGYWVGTGKQETAQALKWTRRTGALTSNAEIIVDARCFASVRGSRFCEESGETIGREWE